MNRTPIFLAFAAVVRGAASLHAQNFTNLNFESAQIIPASTNANGSVNIASANALQQAPEAAEVESSKTFTILSDDSSRALHAPIVVLFNGNSKSVAGEATRL